MEGTTLTIIVSLVAIVLAGFAVYKAHEAGTPMTPGTFTGALEEAMPQATELTEAALTGARAAEQLYRTGRITRDARLSKALNYVRTWFPDLDDDTLITAIESAVLVVNTVVAAVPDGTGKTLPRLIGQEGRI